MSRRIGILRFLGTNCDRDIWQAVEALGAKPEWLWYEDRFQPEGFDAFIVPGGFSYGDYLRCGALAAKSPVMESLSEAAKKGYPVLGICNGFQILCEARLLPGVLVANESRRFIDKWVDLVVQNPSKWGGQPGEVYRMPIAHGEGRFYAEESEVRRLFDNGQVWLTYKENPNGSIGDIAGVSNEGKNVCALMPHPERAAFEWMGGVDGRRLLAHLLQ